MLKLTSMPPNKSCLIPVGKATLLSLSSFKAAFHALTSCFSRTSPFTFSMQLLNSGHTAGTAIPSNWPHGNTQHGYMMVVCSCSRERYGDLMRTRWVENQVTRGNSYLKIMHFCSTLIRSKHSICSEILNKLWTFCCKNESPNHRCCKNKKRFKRRQC